MLMCVVGSFLKKQQMTENKFTFIDLFAGIGGFRLAMQKHGGSCVFSSEFNPQAQKTYAHNHGEVPFGDITDPNIKAQIPTNFDIICAGVPCQAFSIAGKRLGFEDTRGTLFFDVAEIIKNHKPKAVLIENVKNLETHDRGNTLKVMKATLEELGYSVCHKIMDSAKYANIPQHRERIIIVAFNKETVPDYQSFEFPTEIERTKTIHDCIETNTIDDKYFYTDNCSFYQTLKSEMKNKDTVYQWRRKYCRENKSNLCPTLTANMGTGGHNVPLILTADNRIRKLTPKECLNFMGYPSDFNFPDSVSNCARYTQAGNSVVVPMIEKIAENIVKLL